MHGVGARRLVTRRPVAARRQENRVTNDINGPAGFETDIKPMFRERDQKAMQSRRKRKAAVNPDRSRLRALHHMIPVTTKLTM